MFTLFAVNHGDHHVSRVAAYTSLPQLRPSYLVKEHFLVYKLRVVRQRSCGHRVDVDFFVFKGFQDERQAFKNPYSLLRVLNPYEINRPVF